MRSVSRVADVSINTVSKLLINAGLACARFHDEAVRDVKAQRIQCNEIWSFCYAKEKNVPKAKSAPQRAGDVWTWAALLHAEHVAQTERSFLRNSLGDDFNAPELF